MKRFTAYILSMLFSMVVMGQGDITVLDWDVLVIDTVAPPVYSETVPLPADYRSHDYNVRVEYPQWGPLTAAETRVMRRFVVADTLQVTTDVATMNHMGYLHIEFCPIVRKGNAYRRLLSARITIESSKSTSSSAFGHTSLKLAPQSPKGEKRVETSLLSSGRWLKIKTTTEGVHRITREQLSKWGFSDPSKVRVYGYGGHLLPECLELDKYFDDLPEVPVYLHTDGSLMFWMNGLTSFDNISSVSRVTPRHTTNYCASYACYFLTEGTPGLPSEPSSSANPKQTLTSFTHTALYEKDEFSYANMSRCLFDAESTSAGSSKSYAVSTPSPKGGSTTARVLISFSAAAPGRVTPSFNGNSAQGFTMPSLDDYVKAVVLTKAYNANISGDDNSAMVVKLDHEKFNGHLDYIEATYERRLTMVSAPWADELMFTPSVTGITAFRIDNPAGDDLVLMRLPEPGMPGARIMPRADGTFVVDDARHTYVAFRPATVQMEPESMGTVENQNLHAHSADVDMVIITPASGIFDSEAHRLAEAHAQTDGLRCRVVRADHIYNEFSSGTPDVSAYRLYMKMLYDQAVVSGVDGPRYLLLFGDCAADNRMLSSSWKKFSPYFFLLCYENDREPEIVGTNKTETLLTISDTESYVSDDFICMLDDGEGARPKSDMPDISVGRFTVKTLAEARTVVDKTIRHLKGDPGAWQNRVVFLGDDGDKNSHMDYADKVARVVERDAPDMEVRRIMWDAYKRVSSTLTNTFPDCKADIKRLNQEGVLVFNYTGHGATYVLSHESVLTLDDIRGLKNTHLPLWFTAACDVMPIDGTADNIGRAALLNTRGGAVVFIGTTRTVYASDNYFLNREFSSLLFATDANGRRYSAGEALRLAKNAAGVPNKANKLHYAYAGDPSLVFGNPAQKVILDQINSQAVTSASDISELPRLRAGSRATMAGHVVDADGNLMTGFNGILAARVLDSEVTVTCHNADGKATSPFVFTDRNKVLFEGTDSVRQGRFCFSFIVPIDINYSNLEGRVSFFATSDGAEANGHSSDFTVGGISNELAADTIGPELFITLDRDDFPAGGTTNATPYFMATLRDSSGINLGAGGIGHNLQLVIDDNVSTTYDLTNYYTAVVGDFTQGQVAFPIPPLPSGEHSLVFRAWDLLNNQSVASLPFVVDASIPPTVARVRLMPNPASTHTNIYVTHNSAGLDINVEINVYDYSGRLLNTFTAKGDEATPTIYVPWNLTTGAGVPLGAGLYLVRTRICVDGEWSDAETQKLFILRQ